MFERSLTIQPSYTAQSNLAAIYYFEGRYADAATLYEEILQYSEGNYRAWGQLAAAYYWTPGKREEALRAYQKAIEMAEEMLREVNPEDSDALSRLANLYAQMGEHEKARSRIEHALRLAPEAGGVLFRASYTYERLGEREAALYWIEKALDHGYPLTYVEHEPALTDLRSDPRFREILQEVTSRPDE